MPSAEIISIGTELLLGEITDTNSSHIAKALRGIGVDVYRTSSVGDNAARIAQTIIEAMNRCNIIITTGGLGPTIDDATRDGVAQALGVDTVFLPELWEQVKDRFKRFHRTPTENNKRQAYIPARAIPIENPVGTAPAFIVEIKDQSIISLPGVPKEMETLLTNRVLPYLSHRYSLSGMIKTRILRTAGIGESQIDEIIQDLEKLTNPTVGLAAHAGQTDVRITAKGLTEDEADELIADVESELRTRLGRWIFGIDHETLEGNLQKLLKLQAQKIALIECGLGGELLNRLIRMDGLLSEGVVLPFGLTKNELMIKTNTFHPSHPEDVCVGISLLQDSTQSRVEMIMIGFKWEETKSATYGGPFDSAPSWAANICLNQLLRKVTK